MKPSDIHETKNLRFSENISRRNASTVFLIDFVEYGFDIVTSSYVRLIFLRNIALADCFSMNRLFSRIPRMRTSTIEIYEIVVLNEMFQGQRYYYTFIFIFLIQTNFTGRCISSVRVKSVESEYSKFR